MFSIDRSDHAAARGQALSNRFTANGFFGECSRARAYLTDDPRSEDPNDQLRVRHHEQARSHRRRILQLMILSIVTGCISIAATRPGIRSGSWKRPSCLSIVARS
jgi:hypothetical protein